VISRFFGLHDDSAAAVQHLFGRVSESISTLALVLSLVTSIIFTTSVAAVQQRGFEMIWTLPRFSGVRSYLRQLVWTPMLAVFSVLVLLAGRFGREVDPSGHGPGTWVIIGLQGFLTFLFYWWTQHWLLRGRVEWKALFLGSFTVGVLTTILVRLSRVIMPPQISWQVHAYGLIGAVFVLSIWLMVSSVLVFGGVLFGALVAEKKAGRPRYRRDELRESPLTRKGHNSAAAAQDHTDELRTAEFAEVENPAPADVDQVREDHAAGVAQMAAFRR
jgi:membrane protein